MEWIEIRGLRPEDQPRYLIQEGGPEKRYEFCFPGDYSKEFSDRLELLGFRRTADGLTAPMTFETADALRGFEDVTLVEKELEEIRLDRKEERIVPLSPVLQHLAEQFPEELPLIRQASFATQTADWSFFREQHPDSAQRLADIFAADLHRALVDQGWKAQGNDHWPLMKNGLKIIREKRDATLLPAYSLYQEDKKWQAVQTLEHSPERIAFFADQRAEKAGEKNTDPDVLPRHPSPKQVRDYLFATYGDEEGYIDLHKRYRVHFEEGRTAEAAIDSQEAVTLYIPYFGTKLTEDKRIQAVNGAWIVWKEKKDAWTEGKLSHLPPGPESLAVLSLAKANGTSLPHVGEYASSNNAASHTETEKETPNQTLPKIAVEGTQSLSNVAPAAHTETVLVHTEDASPLPPTEKDTTSQKVSETASAALGIGSDAARLVQDSHESESVLPYTSDTHIKEKEKNGRLLDSDRRRRGNRDGRIGDSESARLSVLADPVELSDGEQTGLGVGDVYHGEKGNPPATSGRNDGKGNAGKLSAGSTRRNSSGRAGGTGQPVAVPGGRNQSGRDADALRAQGKTLGLDGTFAGPSDNGDDSVGDEIRIIESPVLIQTDEHPRNSRNHRIRAEDELVPGGTASRAKANIEAIRVLKKLEEENREATSEEKRILTRFGGWGSLAQEIFKPEYEYAALREQEGMPHYASIYKDPAYKTWKEKYGKILHPAFDGLLSTQEWNAAKTATLNAHYTSKEVIESMWRMVERFGFQGGRVVEPSAGTGLFLGLMPDRLAAASSLAGVELDSLTGGILQKLYPDADIQVTGFENAKRMNANATDLVISNFPFGNYKVTDKKHPKESEQSIHNYFISRSLDMLRPGGLMVGITSHFSLDAATGGKIRADWAKKADLVGAIRLPNTAFKKNAGTEVTTDILIFRKKSETPFPASQPFEHVVEVETPQGTTFINEYFAAHPEMVLGEHSLSGTMYGKQEYTLTPSSGESLQEGLERVLELLPANIMGKRASHSFTEEKKITASDSEREGALVIHEGKPFLVYNGVLEIPKWADSEKKTRQALRYVELKNALKELIQAMNRETDDEPIVPLREKLNTVYDAYVQEYGTVTTNRKSSFLAEDLEYPNVAALERTVTRKQVSAEKKRGEEGETSEPLLEEYIEKADIFTRRTIYPFILPEKADSLEDAVKISRVYRNGIDVSFIARLRGTDDETVRKSLAASDLAFLNPETGLFEARDLYLSGNVGEKLRLAELAAQDDPDYEHNVAALRDVQPPYKTIDQIRVKLGTSWMPLEVIKAFLEDMGVEEPVINKVRAEGEDGSTHWRLAYKTLKPEAFNRWSVEGVTLPAMVQDALNLKRTSVWRDSGEGENAKREKDQEKSLAAQEKQKEIQEAFQDWLKKNDKHAQIIEEIYNDLFNGHVVRKFEVPAIKHYPGASQDFTLRPNQKIAVSRALQESALLAHGVGTGKTFELITLAMEMRRLATARKPWIVVQGSTVSQFAASFKQLYPGARILAPSEKQRDATNRRRLLSQIATGDWDAIITPHSFFNSVSIDPQNEKAFIREQLAELEQLLLENNQKQSKEESRLTTKMLQKKMKTLENRFIKLGDIPKDENLFFEDLGIDALLIDEAHTYKRGSFYTKMDQVKGLDRDSSQRSQQLLMKARHVQSKTGGKNVILATGTPISNTLTELWTLFRYIRPDLLEAFHITQFDDFASTFAETSTELEETSTGDFKMVERFNTYTNGLELLTLWRSGTDVALAEDMDYLKDVPRLHNDKIQEVVVERSEALTHYIRHLKKERDDWDALPPREKMAHPGVPLQIYGKAKRAAIDLRLIDGAMPDIPESKANKCMENVLRIWRENSESRAAQLVFCDNFQSSDKQFNLFRDIKRKLIANGIPEGQIAIIHDFATDKARNELFDKVNRGEIRVLMGTTERLGVGVNVQERLIALHHLDAPLRPMDFEQRNGRIRRSGNMFPEVKILTYGTKNTLDSVIFQQLISKQKFINQVLRGDIGDNTFENPFDEVQASFEDLMAVFSGNPLAKEKMKLQADIRRLQSLQSAHMSRLASMRGDLRSYKSMLERSRLTLVEDKKAKASVELELSEGKIRDRKKVAETIDNWLETANDTIQAKLKKIDHLAQWQVSNPKDFLCAATLKLAGDLTLELKAQGYMEVREKKLGRGINTFFEMKGPHNIAFNADFKGAGGLLTRVENRLNLERQRPEKKQKYIKHLEETIASLEVELQKPFPQEQELEEAQKQMKEIEKALSEAVNEDLETEKAKSKEENQTEKEPTLIYAQETSTPSEKDITHFHPLFDGTFVKAHPSLLHHGSMKEAKDNLNFLSGAALNREEEMDSGLHP